MRNDLYRILQSSGAAIGPPDAMQLMDAAGGYVLRDPAAPDFIERVAVASYVAGKRAKTLELMEWSDLMRKNDEALRKTIHAQSRDIRELVGAA